MHSEPEPANRNPRTQQTENSQQNSDPNSEPEKPENSEPRSKAKHGNIEVRPLKTPSKRVATYYPFNLGARPHRWKSKRWIGTISQRSCLVSRLLSLPSSRAGKRSEQRGGRCRPAALSRFRPGLARYGWNAAHWSFQRPSNSSRFRSMIAWDTDAPVTQRRCISI